MVWAQKIYLSLVSVVNHWTPTSYFQLLSSLNLAPETLNSESLLVGSIKLQKLSSDTGMSV